MLKKISGEDEKIRFLKKDICITFILLQKNSKQRASETKSKRDKSFKSSKVNKH